MPRNIYEHTFLLHFCIACSKFKRTKYAQIIQANRPGLALHITTKHEPQIMDQQKQKAQQLTTTDVGSSADLRAQITDQQKQEAQLSTTTDVGSSADLRAQITDQQKQEAQLSTTTDVGSSADLRAQITDQQKQEAQLSTTTDVGLSADLRAQITDQQKQEAQLLTTTDASLSTDPWGGFPCAAQGHEEVEDGPAVPEDALKPMCSCVLHWSSCFSLFPLTHLHTLLFIWVFTFQSLPSPAPAHTSVHMGLHFSVSLLSHTWAHSYINGGFIL